MERINIYYLIAAILVIGFVWGIMGPPIIRVLEAQYTDILYRWIVLAIGMPIITILLLYITLAYIRGIYQDSSKEKVKDLITPELSEEEIFNEAVFENEKLRVLNVIKTFKKLKGNKISLSAIKSKTGFAIDDIEDMILLLLAEELLDGDLEYPKDGPVFVFPEKKEVKVKYIDNLEDNLDKNQNEE